MAAPSCLQPLPQATVGAHGPSLLGHPPIPPPAPALLISCNLISTSLLLHNPPTILPTPFTGLALTFPKVSLHCPSGSASQGCSLAPRCLGLQTPRGLSLLFCLQPQKASSDAGS